MSQSHGSHLSYKSHVSQSQILQCRTWGACHMVFEYESVKKWGGNLPGKTEIWTVLSRLMSRPFRAHNSFSCPPRVAPAFGVLTLGWYIAPLQGLRYATKPPRDQRGFSVLRSFVSKMHVTCHLSTKPMIFCVGFRVVFRGKNQRHIV